MTYDTAKRLAAERAALALQAAASNAPRAFGFADAIIARANLSSYFEWLYFEDGAECRQA